MKANETLFVERKSGKAFTLVELLVIIAVVVVLIVLQLPALAKVNRQTLQAQCAGNLRQFALAVHIYAGENNDRLPPATGNWPWDMATPVADAIVLYGAPRPVLYCPAFPEQNVDGLWNYSPAFRVIGYVTSFGPAPSISTTNLNTTLTPQRTSPGPILLPPGRPALRVLVADSVMSQIGQNNPSLRTTYQFASIPGGSGPAFTHRSSHLDKLYPTGGNVAMMDGHVEWKRFEQMIPRTDTSSPTPVWW